MPASTYQDFLKVANAWLREGTAAEQAQQAAKIAEVQAILTLQGANSALWDYPTGVASGSGLAGNVASTVYDNGKDFLHKPLLVRVSAVGGASATCTYAVQGSVDSAFTSPVSLNYADYLTPTTVVSTTFTLTPVSTTVVAIKLIVSRQAFRFVRILASANTAVTNTYDITTVG